MEPSSINRQSNMQPAGTIGVQAPRVGRFGLAAKSSLANRVSPLQTEIPTLTEAGSKEGAKELSEGHQVKQVTNGKENPLSNEKVTGAIFSKVHPNEKEDKELKTRPGEVLIIDQSKKLNRIAVDSKGPKGKEKETNEKAIEGLPTNQNESVKQKNVQKEGVKGISHSAWSELENDFKTGQFFRVKINIKTNQGEVFKAGDLNLKNDLDTLIMTKSGQIIFISKEQQERHQNLDSYQLNTSDDSIRSHIDNVKTNFSSNNAILLTKDQVNILQTINQKRIADKKREEELKNQEKDENESPEESYNKAIDQGKKTDSTNTNPTLNKNQSIKQKRDVGGYRSLFAFENMKNRKAEIEETKEKKVEEKKEEERTFHLINNEKIDDRVQERLKEKIELDLRKKNNKN